MSQSDLLRYLAENIYLLGNLAQKSINELGIGQGAVHYARCVNWFDWDSTLVQYCVYFFIFWVQKLAFRISFICDHVSYFCYYISLHFFYYCNNRADAPVVLALSHIASKRYGLFSHYKSTPYIHALTLSLHVLPTECLLFLFWTCQEI